MVKIDTLSSSQKVTLNRVSKSNNTRKASFTASVNQKESVDELSQISGSFPTQPLLILQGVTEKQIAKEHGDKVLNLLDQLRIGLLTGQLTDQHLQSLASYLKNKTLSFSDPNIKQTMEEIEQRANIELAKRGLI